MLNSYSIKIMKLRDGDTEKRAKGSKTIVRTKVRLTYLNDEELASSSLPTNQLQFIYVVVNTTESLQSFT